MVNVCFYFQVHQPSRLRNYSVFDVGNNSRYFDEQKNKAIMQRVAKKCYLPMNRLILDSIDNTDGRFKASYSLTGIFLEQAEMHCPAIIDSFKELVKTGNVELLSETYHHSLAYLYSKKEFDEQVRLHQQKIWQLFRYKPQVFRNTELIYNNEIANHVQGLGFKGILAEGADHILGWRSPNFVYTPKTAPDLKLLLKNYKLSDDIAFRFSNSSWKEYPLTSDKFTQWVDRVNGNGSCVNLFMDYETFGEHQWSQTGIFRFMKHLPHMILKHPDNRFMTPSEVMDNHDAVDEIDAHNIVSWADVERDLSAWLGNKMQHASINKLYQLEGSIKASGDKVLLDAWRKLQTSDHFYYMCTKWFADGDVHKYFNPYDSPYDSFITYMNVLNDIMLRLKAKESGAAQGQAATAQSF